jgi:hypothetical protein
MKTCLPSISPARMRKPSTNLDHGNGELAPGAGLPSEKRGGSAEIGAPQEIVEPADAVPSIPIALDDHVMISIVACHPSDVSAVGATQICGPPR